MPVLCCTTRSRGLCGWDIDQLQHEMMMSQGLSDLCSRRSKHPHFKQLLWKTVSFKPNVWIQKWDLKPSPHLCPDRRRSFCQPGWYFHRCSQNSQGQSSRFVTCQLRQRLQWYVGKEPIWYLKAFRICVLFFIPETKWQAWIFKKATVAKETTRPSGLIQFHRNTGCVTFDRNHQRRHDNSQQLQIFLDNTTSCAGEFDREKEREERQRGRQTVRQTDANMNLLCLALCFPCSVGEMEGGDFVFSSRAAMKPQDLRCWSCSSAMLKGQSWKSFSSHKFCPEVSKGIYHFCRWTNVEMQLRVSVFLKVHGFSNWTQSKRILFHKRTHSRNGDSKLSKQENVARVFSCTPRGKIKWNFKYKWLNVWFEKACALSPAQNFSVVFSHFPFTLFLACTRHAFYIPDCNQYLVCGSTHNLQYSYQASSTSFLNITVV